MPFSLMNLFLYLFSTVCFFSLHFLVGYKSRTDSSMFGVNQNIVDREVTGKINEYENHGELKELSKLYEIQKVFSHLTVQNLRKMQLSMNCLSWGQWQALKILSSNHGISETSNKNFCMKSQVELKIEVATGPSPKTVALKIAQDLKATWIILDRCK